METGSDGKMVDVSVQAKAGASVEELAKPLPNNKVGVTTVGEITEAGGTVTPAPQPGDPNHARLDGLTPEQGAALFEPNVRPNPVPPGDRGIKPPDGSN